MANVTFSKGSEIVQEICTQVGDSNLTKYADSTTYFGRAYTLFLRSVRDMLETPKRYNLTEDDYRGMIYSQEVVVGGVGDENGQIPYASLTKFPKDIINIFTNPDSDNDQLPYILKEINADYPQYAEGEEAKDNYFYSPIIYANDERGWYKRQAVASVIQFYPVSGTGEQTYYVTVKYVAEMTPASYDKDTVFYIGGTAGLFSLRFIDLAISMAVNKILAEREI